MWVVPEVKQATSSFQTVMKYSAICVIVTLSILFLRNHGLSPGGSAEYQCNEVGRFPDPKNNINCYRSYVLCIRGEDWKSYSCPLGTRFDEFEGRCISDPENEVECLSSSGDTELTELFSDRYTANFICPSVGVFRNEQSVTCADYILCVNTMQANIYAIYLHCDQDQLFSHEHQACIDMGSNYCDDNGVLYLINHPPTRPLSAATPSALEQTTAATATTQPTTTTTQIIESTTAPTTVEVLVTTTTVTITTKAFKPQIEEYKETTTLPTIKTTKDANEEDGEDDSDELEFIPPAPVHPQPISNVIFKCPDVGRFQNPLVNYSDATKYILCTVDFQSNSLQGYIFSCPGTTVFSPEMSRCVRKNLSLVEVITEVITEKTPTTTDGVTEETTTELITESTTQEVTTTESVTLSTSTDLSTLTTDRPITSTDLPITSQFPTTISEIITTEAPATITSVPIAPYSKDPTFCTAKGRFHTEYTLDCRSYLLCIENSSGDLMGTYFKCPSDSKFSDAVGRCVRDYDCPYYHCTQPGTFPYVKDKDRYVLCLRSGADKLVAYRMKCPKDMNFSNILRRCIPERLRDLMVWK